MADKKITIKNREVTAKYGFTLLESFEATKRKQMALLDAATGFVFQV
jgi:hypothetical protein